ncbi:putative ribosomal protein S5 domain 2-type protein [Paratrimastix pyriformis]|uniref:Ribosomal protein S5 domain 2-type protein n=1 Tax=Paratrimastix pyriformis TaxID=342808 RepID=A0ABQ8UUT5_9EUKA|nr:putative ribosomal protein S5 domain 2-type protein [Paratrimastix pyriformis]
MELFSPNTPVIFNWIEWLREHAPHHVLSVFVDHWIKNPPPPPAVSPASSCPPSTSTRESEPATPPVPVPEEPEIEIIHGPPFVDRKSKFVAHLARVKTLAEVEQMRAILLRDKRIAQATHNVLAYRLSAPLLEARDDDGEGGAGDTMLYLLQKMNVMDVAVLVTRWFGGILLGPDRFRHFQDLTKAIVDQAGMTASGKPTPPPEKEKRPTQQRRR